MLEQGSIQGLEQLREAMIGSPSHDVDVLQLSSGTASCAYMSMEDDEVLIRRTRFSARHRWLDTRRDNSVHLVLPSGATREGATVNGQPYNTDNFFCLSKPGRVTSVSESGFDCFEIIIGASLADDVGLSSGHASFLNAPTTDLDRLRRCLREVLRPADARKTSENPRHFQSEQVIGAVGRIFRSLHMPDDKMPDGTRDRDLIVAHAEAIMNDWDPEAKLEVELLCRELGIPRRTLHHAFRESLGLGPLAFHRLKKLHAFRAALETAEREKTRVADVAHAFGFFELGRLAARYKAIFGELPSETMRRRRN